MLTLGRGPKSTQEPKNSLCCLCNFSISLKLFQNKNSKKRKRKSQPLPLSSEAHCTAGFSWKRRVAVKRSKLIRKEKASWHHTTIQFQDLIKTQPGEHKFQILPVWKRWKSDMFPQSFHIGEELLFTNTSPNPHILMDAEIPLWKSGGLSQGSRGHPRLSNPNWEGSGLIHGNVSTTSFSLTPTPRPDITQDDKTTVNRAVCYRHKDGHRN